MNHQELHDVVNESINWQGARETYIRLWDTSLDRAMTSPPLMPGDGCSPAYMPWYLGVTCRYMVKPRFWTTADAFRGTQGAIQSLVNDFLIKLFTVFHNYFSSIAYVMYSRPDFSLHVW